MLISQLNLYNNLKKVPIYILDFQILYQECFDFRTQRFLFSLILIFFALAGFPPFATFFGKFLIFKTLIAHHYYFTTILLIFFSVLSTFYYIRILKCLLFEDFNFFNV